MSLVAKRLNEWTRIPLGTEVGLGQGYIVLDGPSSNHGKEHRSPPLFGPCLLWRNCRPSQQLLSSCCVFRLHRSSTYIDATYCYRCGIICRSICHAREPCKNGSTGRDSVWVVWSDGPKEPRIRWGSRFPMVRGNLLGEEWPSVKHRDNLR